MASNIPSVHTSVALRGGQQLTCSDNASLPCPWPRLGVHEALSRSRTFANRSCTANALGVKTMVAMLKLLHSNRPERGREGQASAYELDSWLEAPVRARRICEIGVNAGESAVAWLCAFPESTYLGFDIAVSQATLDATLFLERAFPGRFRLIRGDTLTTLPHHARQNPHSCDVVSVDGGHKLQIAYSDLTYMRLLAAREATLVMDDLRCSWWFCKDPTSAWSFFVRRGVVQEHGCFVKGCCEGWCWGKFNHSAPQPEPMGICDPPTAPDKWCRSSASTRYPGVSSVLPLPPATTE